MKNISKSRCYHFRKKHLFWFIPSGILLIMLLLLLLSPLFIKAYINYKIEKIEEEKNIIVTYDKISIKRYSTLILKNFTVIQKNAVDTFLCFTELHCNVEIFKNRRFNPHAANFYLDNVKVNFIKKGEISNYSFLESGKMGKMEKKEPDYPEKINYYLDLLIRLFPKDLQSNTIRFRTEMDSVITEYHLINIKISESGLSGKIRVEEQQHVSHWLVSGKVDVEKNYFSGKLSLDEQLENVGRFPFIEMLFKTDITFHLLAFTLDVKKQDVDNARFTIGGKVLNLQFYHPGIADRPAKIDSASFALNVELHPNSIQVDSTSEMLLNGFAIHPCIKYEKLKEKHIVFKINERNFSAASFFNAMPEELFQVIPDLEAKGKMDFFFLFDCDFSKVDELVFDFNIEEANLLFSENSIGTITRFNAPFEYVFYEDEIPVRTMLIGADNPAFCSFEKIPPLLKYAILASEDASFFRHNGFLKSSIRDAMVTNIKRGKFSRGGSTITMQLVKNLLLNRKKVASRKFEEMVLTWMIENKNLISKERMFEIYINIIEWGPCVYGITEAADFYFDKKPEMLTFGECVYLATLIRSPRLYAYTLDSGGNVKDGRRSEMRFVAQRMLEKEMITEEQFATFNSFVTTRIDELKQEKYLKICEEARTKAIEQ